MDPIFVKGHGFLFFIFFAKNSKNIGKNVSIRP